MSLRDLCDVAYVLQVEQVERRAAALVPLVKEPAALPDEMRAEFDAALLAEPPKPRPTPAGSDRLVQMRSLLTDLGVT